MNILRLKTASLPLLVTLAIFSVGASLNANAADAQKKTQADLLAVLPQAKLSLADGIRQATGQGETPLSAKFEFDDEGKLSLSVYVAGKGAGVAAENNVLKELSGDATAGKWKPKTEVFADVPHVARSAQQLTLIAIGHTELTKVIDRAQQEHRGKVYSITPMLVNNTPQISVLLINNGKSSEYTYQISK